MSILENKGVKFIKYICFPILQVILKPNNPTENSEILSYINCYFIQFQPFFAQYYFIFLGSPEEGWIETITANKINKSLPMVDIKHYVVWCHRTPDKTVFRYFLTYGNCLSKTCENKIRQMSSTLLSVKHN